MSTVGNRLNNGITPNYRVSAGQRENMKTLWCNCREIGSLEMTVTAYDTGMSVCKF
jgi:hypothetical protein